MINIEEVIYHNEGVTVHFTYKGDDIEFDGHIRLSPKEYKASGNGEDLEYLVKCVLARELHHLVNGY